MIEIIGIIGLLLVLMAVCVAGVFVLALIGAGLAEQEGYRPSEREGGTHADTEGI